MKRVGKIAYEEVYDCTSHSMLLGKSNQGRSYGQGMKRLLERRNIHTLFGGVI
jgi:hypothetical protein